jgi:hypothetical protein
MGKTIGEVEASLAGNSAVIGGSISSRPEVGKNKNELSAVLDSLSKLAELENRISSLEKDNTHDYLLTKEASSGTRVQGPSGLEFKRKRVNVNSIGPGGKGPLGVKYSVGVKQKQSSWQQQQQQGQQRSGVVGGVSRGSGVMAARVGRYNNTSPVQRPVAGPGPARGGYQNGRLNNNQKALTSKMNAGGGGGVFLTGMEYGGDDELNDDEAREVAKRERRRQVAMAPAGQKNLRERMNTRKMRDKEKSVGVLKHEEALREMAKRKSNQSFQVKNGQINNNNRMNNPGLNRVKTNAQSVSAVNKGASSGLKTKNKYLQDFEKLKAGYSNKKSAKQFFSQTADNDTDNEKRSPERRRMPSTQTSGTTTRRSVCFYVGIYSE